MNKNDFIFKLKDIVDNYKTIYMWGVFGAPVTKSLLNEKTKQYPNWYNVDRIKMIEKCIGGDYFAFDCVNLIKGILWGWDGDIGHIYGGATYPNSLDVNHLREEKSIPDVSADTLISMCDSISGDFSDIESGEVVWIKGHIGVYIGNNTVIECTPSWNNGVQYTTLGNLKSSNMIRTRIWTKHGKLPYVDYDCNKEKNWEEIIRMASSSHTLWIDAINDFNNVASKSNLGNLGILQYFNLLIEKVYMLNYTEPLSWVEIISKVSTNTNDWRVAIDAIVAASKSEGNIGNIEIFRFIPELIMKVYNLNK